MPDFQLGLFDHSNWKHLRVPFQMTLAPIFLWGYFLARSHPDGRFFVAFIAFHLCLYTGITAFNSYYDRDEGPIGGLEHPPDVYPTLLPLSIGLQVVGLLPAVWVGGPFITIYLLFVILGLLYSHPRTRWKASPTLSTLTVFGGQGALGFLAGWAVAKGEVASVVSLTGLLGFLSAAFTTLGMYPLTQVYQVEEDLHRGDRTLSVVFGADRALYLSLIAFLIAGVAAVLLAARNYTPQDAGVLVIAYIGLCWYVDRFRRRYASLQQSEAYHTVSRLNYASSIAISLFICLRLARWF